MFYLYAFSFCGSWARIMAANMITQPVISLPLKCCPRITQPARTEIQDSRLRIRDATVGFIFFCPMICKVYATPQDITPAYRIGCQAVSIADISGFSKISAGIPDRIPHTRNWMQDIFTPSTFGE